MAYIFKFKHSEKVLNYVTTSPKVSFSIYSGSAYLNNAYNLEGAYSSSISGAPTGYITLLEKNVDRKGAIVPTSHQNAFKVAVDNNSDPTDVYSDVNPAINSFVVKDGTRITSKTVSVAEYNSVINLGDVLTGSTHYSASIHKFYYAATDSKYATSQPTGPSTGVTGSVTYLYALANTIDFYQPLSPQYAVSSSYRDLTSSVVDEGAIASGLVTIPGTLYGDTIKKGSIDLRFYVTGTLVGQLKDERQNGELIQVGPVGSPYSGAVAGLALYNEGFLLLTGSWDISQPSYVQEYGTDYDYPAWVNFAQPLSSSAPTSPSSSFVLDFEGQNTIPVMTMFATAPKNYLNHSNNPTFRDYSSNLFLTSGSKGYMQNNEALIKNTTSSSYNDPTGSFTKTTYITTIGIYDEQKNLIGIAKTSKPIKKTEERDLTFKLKIDF